MTTMIAENPGLCKLRSVDPAAVNAFQILVDKEIAEYLLSLNFSNNRNLSHSRVMQYRRQMNNGEWMVGDAIKISKDNILIDGQHRLSAITDDMKIPMIIMTGLPSMSAECLDQGLRRSASHIAAIRGLPSIGHPEIGTLRLMFLFRFSDKREIYATDALSAIKVVNIFEKYPEILEAIKFSKKYIFNAHAIRVGPVYAAIARAYLSDYPLSKLDLDYFCYCLQYGKESGYPDQHVIKRNGAAACSLRNYYYDSLKRNKNRESRVDLFYKTQSAIVAYKEGRDLGYIKMTKRNCFPVPFIDQMNMKTLECDPFVSSIA